MLSLRRQEYYRSQYEALRPGWRWSGARYEALIRRYLQVDDAKQVAAKQILDIGCGAGGVIELFSVAVRLPVGIDVDLSSLRRHRDPAVQCVAGTVDRLPFAAASFDLAMSSWTLEHLTRPDLAFREVARVLKPGGHFVFLAPNARSIVGRINRFLPHTTQAPLVGLLYGRGHDDTFPTVYRANTVDDIDGFARAAGLQQVRLETVSDPTYFAFSDLLFRLSVFVERFVPRAAYVHIVGDYVKLPDASMGVGRKNT